MKRFIISIFLIIMIIGIMLLTVFEYCESTENFVDSEASINKRLEEGNRNPEFRKWFYKNFGHYPNFGVRNNSSARPNSVPQIAIDLINNETRKDGHIIYNYPYKSNHFYMNLERNTTIPNYFYFEGAPRHGKLKPTETILEAELRLNRTPMSYEQLGKNQFYYLNLYRIIDPHHLNQTRTQQLIGSKYIPVFGNGVEIFNVTQIVKEWDKGVSQNLGFWVEAITSEGNIVPVKFERHGERTGPTNDPIIVVYVSDTAREEIIGNNLKVVNPILRIPQPPPIIVRNRFLVAN